MKEPGRGDLKGLSQQVPSAENAFWPGSRKAALSSSPISVSHPRYLLARPGRSAPSADSASLDGKVRPWPNSHIRKRTVYLRD